MIMEDVAFTKVEVMIDSELPWATNKTVLMKEEADGVETTLAGRRHG